MKHWIVMASHGDYEDREENPVAVLTSEEDAIAFLRSIRDVCEYAAGTSYPHSDFYAIGIDSGKAIDDLSKWAKIKAKADEDFAKEMESE